MTTYLITGSTRGIGYELVKQLSAKGNNHIIAGVRDPTSNAAKKVAQLGKAITIVKLDSASDTDPKEAYSYLQSQGVHHIDVIIANAGIAADFKAAEEVELFDMREQFNINVVAPLNLFKAFLPLLKKSKTPKFILISTAIASMGYQRNLPFKSTSYGASKAALNFVSLRIAIEHPEIISFPLHPGLVQTDMGGMASQALGMDMAQALSSGRAISVEKSANGIIELISEAKVDSHLGKFFNIDSGSELPW